MINTSVSKNEHTIQSGVVDYPIGFPFYFKPDRTPQLLVKIGDEKLRFNHNFELSEDKGSVVLRPTEEESWTLEGPEDFSWMTKWDGKDLLIERVVPFTQESEYQLGRISSEQIERDFDLSVMRDQILLGKIAERTTDVSEELESLHTDISDINAELATKATKVELDNYKLATNTAIDANADAIQKTRDDYIEADGEIHQILNSHTSELTTLRGNQAALGDQVAGIEEKIPESASDSNPLATKQQLATKQDQLTAGDNIIISNNVISATGAGGGAGFDIVVVQELPATGQKGIIYLLAKDGTAPDVYDEYVWITATQTFELIGSTKVDLSGYLPLSGGTITGPITLGMTGDPFSNVDVLKSSSGASLVTGMIESGSVSTLAIRTPLTIFKELLPLADVGQSFSKVPRIYLEKINNGADISIPTTGGTMALAENVETAISDAVANIDALPDQSGNAGKVLTTDGSTASWQEAPASGTKVIIKRYN